MSDPTEEVRRVIEEVLNEHSAERTALERAHGRVWNGDELQQDFEVLGFLAPYVRVRRKSDGVEGSVLFQHRPRFYWGFSPTE